MAEHASDYTHGHMDIHQNQASFQGFVRLTKWGSLVVAVIVLFATINFCTDAGFFGAAIPAAVLAVLGFVLLRSKPGAAGAH